MDSEGMRKGWTQKVMMKMAMTMRCRRDWRAVATLGRSWCG
jgi:hypothetical protein